MDKIKSGNLLDVASVVKRTYVPRQQRGLSTSERKMLHSAKQILISELVIATDMDYDGVEKRLCAALKRGVMSVSFINKLFKSKSNDDFCTAVVLAVKNSQRMGKDKILMPLGGAPVIAHTLKGTAKRRMHR